ncbi:urease accessory protein UreD [Propylenella binzhouense]|uniref:Urease accessory protein UreD n=1 Tax=Propylenella binzhouense TaxID=2555902 RepID=A0A964WUW6_9HYPH|nr:urease accessory protein UreD [Propylenella binzhouense]
MNAPAFDVRASGAAVAGRAAKAGLRFALAGGRTELVRQHVPYPFHVTRPFRLDRARPEIATLYLQSASGGLYRGDDLSLDLSLGAGAVAHVTTQASTLVHESRGAPSRQAVRIAAAPGSRLLYTPDPMILMPGAAYEGRTRIALADGAAAIVSEGVFAHDPAGAGRPFAHFMLETEMVDAAGRVVACDRGGLAGADFAAAASPLGPYRAYGALFLFAGGAADAPRLPAALPGELARLGLFAALSALPNGAGESLRILAPDGGRLAEGLAHAAMRAFEALFGVAPAPRRK